MGFAVFIVAFDLGLDLHVYGLFRVRGQGFAVHLYRFNNVSLRAFANVQHFPHLCGGQVGGGGVFLGAIVALEGGGGHLSQIGIGNAVAIGQLMRRLLQLFRRKVKIVLLKH